MTDSAQPWPNASKPGVPLNAGVTGWHWLAAPDASTRPYRWFGISQQWDTGSIAREQVDPDIVASLGIRYVEPVYTPTEHAAQLARIAALEGERDAAWQAGAAKMREAASSVCLKQAHACDDDYMPIHARQSRILADAIRALPTPAQDDDA